MATSRNNFPLLQGFILDLNIHASKYGSNKHHPTHTCTSIYEYSGSIEVPKKCNTCYQSQYKNTYKNNDRNTPTYNSEASYNSPTMPALKQMQELLHHKDESSTTKSIIQTPSDSNKIEGLAPEEYIPIIAAFHQSLNIICDKRESKGHHASTCYKRGIHFLPCNAQPCIAAYNAKFSTSPINNTSPDLLKLLYHALDPPDHQHPQQSNRTATHAPTLQEPQQIPTISSLDHVIPTADIE